MLKHAVLSRSRGAGRLPASVLVAPLIRDWTVQVPDCPRVIMDTGLHDQIGDCHLRNLPQIREASFFSSLLVTPRISCSRFIPWGLQDGPIFKKSCFISRCSN